jgi:hypothetical protein
MDFLTDFLRREELAMVWTVQGEKQAMDRSMTEYRGRLDISGNFQLDGEEVTGNLRTLFDPPGAKRDK